MNFVKNKKNSTWVIQHCRVACTTNVSRMLKIVNRLALVSTTNCVAFTSSVNCLLGVNCLTVYTHKHQTSTGVEA